jgi:hypothetical protein
LLLSDGTRSSHRPATTRLVPASERRGTGRFLDAEADRTPDGSVLAVDAVEDRRWALATKVHQASVDEFRFLER